MVRSKQSEGKRKSTRTAGRSSDVWFEAAVAVLTFACVILVVLAVYFFFSTRSGLYSVIAALFGIGTLGAGVLIAKRLEASRKAKAKKKVRHSDNLLFEKIEADISNRVRGKTR